MKDDSSAAPLSRRVPGSTRSAPTQRVRPALSDTDVHRIQAAIDAEHANTEMPVQHEPNTEPLSRATHSGPGVKEVGHPRTTPVTPDATKAPRASEALRAAKALRAAEELRAAERPRAVSPRRAEEPASATGRLRPEEPLVVPEPVRAEEPAVVPQPVGTEEPVFTAQPVVAPEPRPLTAWPPGEPPPGTIGWLWPEDTAPRGGRLQRHLPGRWTASTRSRYRTATLVALGALVLVVGGLAVGISLHTSSAHTGAHAATSGLKASTHSTGERPGRQATTPSRGGGSATASGSRARTHHAAKRRRTDAMNPALTASRTAAAHWIAQQVAVAAVVACDAQTCAALTNSGFSGNQVLIGQKSTSLSNASLIVVTPELRTLITATNRSLGAEVALTDLASFGRGNARVTVQVVSATGAAAYVTALRQSVQTRIKAGKQLLSTGKVSASAAAESDLESGAVDPRLLLVIKAMANLEPVDVVGFSDSGPGSSAGVPFRLMTLGEAVPAASVSAPAYLQAMLHLLQAHASFPAFNHVSQATRSGQKVVEVEYDAPSPLGS